MMKKCLAIILAILMFNMNIFAAIPLERGTMLSVRITSPIDSKQKTSVTAMVENDVRNRVGDIVIKRGTPVLLQVNRKKAKGCGKAGLLDVKCISTTAIDGQSITLEGSEAREGNCKKGLAIGLGVGLGLTFLPFVGFAFLALKGGQAAIEANTIIHNVVVMNDYTIMK